MNELLATTLRDRQALTALRESPGWSVLCAAYKQRLDDLTDTLLNPKTPKEDAEVLRQTRAQVVEQFGPPILLNDLLIKMDLISERELARQKKESPEQPPTP